MIPLKCVYWLHGFTALQASENERNGCCVVLEMKDNKADELQQSRKRAEACLWWGQACL